MLGLGLARCDLGLVMVLQVTVTVRHQTSAHAYGSDGKKAYELKCPQLHAPVAECPSRCQQTNYEIVSTSCSASMSHWFSLLAHFYL